MKEQITENFYVKTSIIILVSTLIGLFGIHSFELLIILFPVLFIVNSIHDTIGEGVLNLAVTLLIISVLDSVGIGIMLGLVFIPFTIMMSYLIKKRKDNFTILGLSSVTFFASILIMISVASLAGVNVVEQIEILFKQLVDGQVEVLQGMDLSNFEFFELKEMFEDTYRYLLLIIPSAVLMLSAVVSYVNYLLSGIILDKLGVKIRYLPKFSRISLPNDIVLGSMIMFLITYISGQLGFMYYETVVMNIMALLLMGFFVQGFSVLAYILNKLKFNIILKVILFVIFIFNSTFVSIITILGAIDLIFDFRKLRRKSKKKS